MSNQNKGSIGETNLTKEKQFVDTLIQKNRFDILTSLTKEKFKNTSLTSMN